MASAVLPNVNKTPVSKEPNHTCFHLIFASGKILNISPNKTEMITIDKMKLIMLNTSVRKLEVDTIIQLLIALSKLETTSEISNKNAIAKIKPKEKRRALIYR